MSFGEIFIVIIIAIIVLKPEDYGSILKSLRSFYAYFNNIKRDIENHISDISADLLQDELDQEQINFYLKKIFALEGSYKGEYSLQEIKKYYHKLLVETRSTD
ncbi:MAG: DUF2672 domain-containing protein [Alphaproteobacteria bacterium]|nr:DUF2672 domain-containing protein [Alphaproteobacteria bacterium]